VSTSCSYQKFPVQSSCKFATEEDDSQIVTTMKVKSRVFILRTATQCELLAQHGIIEPEKVLEDNGFEFPWLI